MLLEIHMLKNYPPVNLNRDESGAPKSCQFGGVLRGRISSQCLKRSWRKSVLFSSAVGENNLGFRTRKLPGLVGEKLHKQGFDAEMIEAVLPKLTAFGKGKKNQKKEKDELITEQVIFYTTDDISAVVNVTAEALKSCKSINDVKKLDGSALQDAVKDAKTRAVTLDMALFGRMVTSNAFRDVDAAMQVGHAISTNKLNMESDYFTVMDDLIKCESVEDHGAGYLDGTDYNSACYYIYASLDTDILLENLKYTPESEALMKKAIPALVRTMALTNPTGKQNSFAGNVLPSAILVECKEEKVPVSMVNAFVKPVRPENGKDLVQVSIQRLAEQADSIQESFGLNVTKRLWFAQKPCDIRPRSEATVCASLPALVEEVAALLN